MTHKLDADDLFIHRIQQHCARLGLNFFLIEPVWVDAFHQAMARGEVWPRVLLNMHSEHHRPDDPYTRLVRLAAEKQVELIDPPDVAQAAFNKARFHPRLMEAGVHVPHTIVVPKEGVPEFRLTEQQKADLGYPFVIKPSLGYGRRGVIMNATSEGDLAKSAADWPDSDYLLQRRMVARSVGEWPVYFRVYHAFGSIWYDWWNCYTDRSRPVTPQEFADLGLKPLEQITRTIASLSRMRFFSTEILQTAEGTFVAIDYVNDQCHMLSQSASPEIGVPNEVVEAIAHRLVEGALELIRNRR
ncbi:MAG TPA: hypothetical protein DCM86_11170 [Verrucomicrobiales bacterium]|nr:hypothetical protein [Verrucomicrobiales bacterium]